MNTQISNTDGAQNGVSLPPRTGSADLRGYAKGYAAGIKRLKALEAEIAKLNEIKTPPPLPDSHDVTIEYLITTAEAMIGAANMLIAMRRENPPNRPSSATC